MMSSVVAADRVFKIAILSVSGIGKQTFGKISRFCSQHQISLSEWWSLSRQAGKLPGLDVKQGHQLRQFQTSFSPDGFQIYLQERHSSVVLDTDQDYPELLTESEEGPAILFIKGEKPSWSITPLAVVGTRKMTGYGEMVTRTLVAQLIDNGVTIVSGGMYGVDMQAHVTALDQKGKTIAVLGFGFDHWYPDVDKERGAALLARGATLVSEFPPFMPPMAGNFPSRNRIVAGMSLGVLVTEAGLESGSHITAGKAVEYNREVFAVPGPITNPFSEGPKWLVNQGAHLVTSADDILEHLGYRASLKPTLLTPKTGRQARPRFRTPLEKILYQELSQQSLSSEGLLAKCQVPIEQLTAVLSQMEINGFLHRDGDWWMVL